MQKKYLSEIIIERKCMDKFKSNNLIISPTGSGKTSFIFGELIKEGNYLYLCDNSNLKSAIELKDRTFSNRKDLYGFANYQVEVMCYKSFGKKIRFNNSIVKEYDAIFCDEVHNLIDYQFINDDTDLSHAIKELFKQYDNTKIFYFTATPYNLELLKKKCGDIDKFVKTLDLTNNREIKRYVNLVTDQFSSYKQIPTLLDNKSESFICNRRKALIYTRGIETMLKLESEISNLGEYFKPICIWSANNEKYPMSDTQIKVREHLIKTGMLLEPYNVLIINRATETGVDIVDKDMLYCIINTTNLTEQIQARGRLRHDIIELSLKADNKIIQKDTYNIDEFLNRPLTKEDKDMLCEKLNLFDNQGRLLKWTRVKNLLVKQGYKVIYDNKSKRIDGKVVKISEITR